MVSKKRFRTPQVREDDVDTHKTSSKILKSIDKKQLKLINQYISDLKEKNLSSDEIIQELSKLEKIEYYIPIEIFDNSKLAVLESVTKYLKENLNLSYHEIASLLNRNDRTIWVTYSKASKKLESKFIIRKIKFEIPISIFFNRRFSPLESLVRYLKSKFSLKNHDIAILLNRDDTTIWTICNRLKRKYEGKI